MGTARTQHNPVRHAIGVLVVLACGVIASGQSWWGAGTSGNTATDPNDPTTQWGNPGNWDTGVPYWCNVTIPITNAGYVYVATTNLQALTVDGTSTEGALCIGNDVTVLVPYGTAAVGQSGKGKIIQGGGSFVVANGLLVGQYAGSSGVYEMHGGVLSSEGQYRYWWSGNSWSYWSSPADMIGCGGCGLFTQTGGTHTVTLSVVNCSPGHYPTPTPLPGFDVGTQGTYNLLGGQLSVQGGAGVEVDGTFNQSGGSSTVSALTLGGIYDHTNGAHTVEGAFVNHGSYLLKGGCLTVGPSDGYPAQEYVGDAYGPGLFTQSGGTHVVNDWLNVGNTGGGGTYKLDGGSLTSTYVGLGNGGDGVFAQTGGIHTVNEQLSVGSSGNGLYQLQGGSLFVGGPEWVGPQGTFQQTGGSNNIAGGLGICQGTFQQTGGLNSITGDVYLDGGSFRQTAGQNSITGNLSVIGNLDVNSNFELMGGLNSIKGKLYVDSSGGGNGHLLLTNGDIYTSSSVIGFASQGSFSQGGGTHASAYSLRLGYAVGATGTYELEAGVLSTDYEMIGQSGAGSLSQRGGTHQVRSVLRLGYMPGSTGQYTISGGRLYARDLDVGYDGHGTLVLASPVADVSVSGALCLGTYGTLNAVDGAAIHLTGPTSQLQNQSTDPVSLSGLGNLTLVVEGGESGLVSLEVAGRDLGPMAEGFQGNFALGTLQLGGDAGVGKAKLVDAFDNQPTWEGGEALYVGNLVLNAGAVIQCNGLRLYYLSGGEPNEFPAPAPGEEAGQPNLYYLNGGQPKQFFMADADLDGAVDLGDLGVLAANWNQRGRTWSTADFTGDGIVSLVDLGLLAANWGLSTSTGGSSVPLSAGAGIPEPASLAILLAGGVVGLLRWPRRVVFSGALSR